MRAYLVKNNVPFDVAMSFDTANLLAWNVILNELDGASFDWEILKWRKLKSGGFESLSRCHEKQPY